MAAVAPEKEEQETQVKATIVKGGNSYRIFGDVGIVNELPNKVLEVNSDMFGLSLEEVQPIHLPEKIYSNDTSFIEHVLKSYASAEGSLGILLSGNKGLGKSFTANVICQKLGLPVIKVTSKFPKGNELFAFLNKIQQEHVIFIDEFEKIFATGVGAYGQPAEDNKFLQQNDFLSFLDNGSIGTKRLFIITANERVSEYLMNRPTRIRYHRKYKTMASEVIREIVEDLLVNQDFKQDLIENIPQKDVNIDVLIKIIQEVNLHNIPYSKFKDFFNFQTGSRENVDIMRENGTIVAKEVDISVPLTIGSTLYYDGKTGYDVDVDEILSETGQQIVVKCSTPNPNWKSDELTPEFDEYITEVFIAKRKYNNLF